MNNNVYQLEKEESELAQHHQPNKSGPHSRVLANLLQDTAKHWLLPSFTNGSKQTNTGHIDN